MYVLLVVHFPTPALPQGAILGPLLFFYTVYINNLPTCLTNSLPIIYAGDMHLTYTGIEGNIIQFCLNENLQNISNG